MTTITFNLFHLTIKYIKVSNIIKRVEARVLLPGLIILALKRVKVALRRRTEVAKVTLFKFVLLCC